MHELALLYGEDPLAAALIPLVVDGTIVAASRSLLLASPYGSRGGVLPWGLLIIASLASLDANVAIAEPSLVGRVIAAWPSFALIGAYEMLMSQIRRFAKPRDSGDDPDPEAVAVPSGRPGDGVFYVDRLAERGVLLGEPYTRQLHGKLRELRFHLSREAVRITYWIASGRRIILLTVFKKQRMREAAEIERAMRAMELCIAEAHTADEE
jgi:hypothetical protein